MNTLGTAVLGHLNVNWGRAAAIVCASVTDLRALIPIVRSSPQSQTSMAKGLGQVLLLVLGRSRLTQRMYIASPSRAAAEQLCGNCKAFSRGHSEQNTLTKKPFILFSIPHVDPLGVIQGTLWIIGQKTLL